MGGRKAAHDYHEEGINVNRQVLAVVSIIFVCALGTAGCSIMNTVTPPRAVWTVQVADNGTYYHVSGAIKNAGGQSLGVGAVAGYALDASGTVLYAAFDVITDILDAGEACEFSLVFSKPASTAADRFRLVISNSPTNPLDPGSHTVWETVVDNPFN